MSPALVRLHGSGHRVRVSSLPRSRWLARAIRNADLDEATWDQIVVLAGACVVLASVPVVWAHGFVRLAGGVVVAGGSMAPWAVLIAQRHRRRRARAAAAAVLLESCAVELRSGSAPRTALVRSQERLPAALRDSVARVIARLEHGAAMSDALVSLCDDDDPPELQTACCTLEFALLGGAAASSLEGAARVLRAAGELDGEVAALTAQVRLSAQVLVALPFAFVVLSTLFGAGTVRSLLLTDIGRACLGVAVVLDAVGWFWLRRLVATVRS